MDLTLRLHKDDEIEIRAYDVPTHPGNDPSKRTRWINFYKKGSEITIFVNDFEDLITFANTIINATHHVGDRQTFTISR